MKVGGTRSNQGCHEFFKLQGNESTDGTIGSNMKNYVIVIECDSVRYSDTPF